MLGDDGGEELTPLDPGWYTELGLSKDFNNVITSGFLQQPSLAMRTTPQGQVRGLRFLAEYQKVWVVSSAGGFPTDCTISDHVENLFLESS